MYDDYDDYEDDYYDDEQDCKKRLRLQLSCDCNVWISKSRFTLKITWNKHESNVTSAEVSNAPKVSSLLASTLTELSTPTSQPSGFSLSSLSNAASGLPSVNALSSLSSPATNVPSLSAFASLNSPWTSLTTSLTPQPLLSSAPLNAFSSLNTSSTPLSALSSFSSGQPVSLSSLLSAVPLSTLNSDANKLPPANSIFQTALDAIKPSQESATPLTSSLTNSIWSDLSAIPQPAATTNLFSNATSIAPTPMETAAKTTSEEGPSIFAQIVCTNPIPDGGSKKYQMDSNLLTFRHLGGDDDYFDFDEPSPDDIVKIAREKKNAPKPQPAKPTVTKPQTSTVPSTAKSVSTKQQPVSKIEKKLDTLKISDSSTSSFASVGPTKPLKGKSVDSVATSSTSIASESKERSKKIDVKEEYKKRNQGKENLNLVVVGHVDAGKSTIMGHMLYLLGEINQKTMKKYERDSEKMNKKSFQYAWVLDESEEERARGITMDIAVNKFETKNKVFTLLDAPGHRDFIPNMISGASQADVGILVVDSTVGEFETGFGLGGQTREHSLLIRSLGVVQLIVAVNKLDNVEWSKQRYDEIIAQLTPFLTQAGFKKSKVRFVPCSGFSGENLIARKAEGLKWYEGPTLVELLDSYEVPDRPIDAPLRLSISDLFKGGTQFGGGSSGSATISGRIDGGYMQIGDKVKIMPMGEIGTIKDILLNDDTVKWAVAGDNVMVTISNVEFQNLSKGSVVCNPEQPIPVTTRIKAQIVTFDLLIPLTPGCILEIHYSSSTETASLAKLVSIVDKSTGEVVKKNPRAIPKNSSAVVIIQMNRAVCIETFKNSKELGRFILRYSNAAVAAGIVTEILSYEVGQNRENSSSSSQNLMTLD
ncbi:HBS1-like protein [Nowakowskiella sp. JEL0407]|nr:HBS1-like protein [Nowakowskiella sp. JEL0407]